jgi:hypothetical protein
VIVEQAHQVVILDVIWASLGDRRSTGSEERVAVVADPRREAPTRPPEQRGASRPIRSSGSSSITDSEESSTMCPTPAARAASATTDPSPEA